MTGKLKPHTPFGETRKFYADMIKHAIETLEEVQQEIQATTPLIKAAAPLIPYLGTSRDRDLMDLFGFRDAHKTTRCLKELRAALDTAREHKARTENAPGHVYTWEVDHHHWDENYYCIGPIRFKPRWCQDSIGTRHAWKTAHECSGDHFFTYKDLQRWPIVKAKGAYVYVIDPKGKRYRLVADTLGSEAFHSCGRVFAYSKPGAKYKTSKQAAATRAKTDKERVAELRRKMHAAHPDKGGDHETFIQARKAYEAACGR